MLWGKKWLRRLAGLKPAAILLGMTAAGFMMGEGRILGNLVPAPAALLAVTGVHGLPVLPVAIGVVAGMLAPGDLAPAALLPVLSLVVAWTVLRSGRRTVDPTWGCVMLLLARMTALPFFRWTPYAMMQFLMETVLAVVMYVAAHGSMLAWQRGRLFSGGGETVCLVLVAGMALGGLPSASVPWVQGVVLFLASVAILGAAMIGGALASTACAVALGGMLWLMEGLDAVTAACLGICGLVSGGLRMGKKYLVGAGFLLGSCVLGLALGFPMATVIPYPALGAALAVLLAVPQRLWEAWSRPELAGPIAASARIGADIQEIAVERMDQFAACFREMAAAFHGMSEGDPRDRQKQMAEILQDVAEHVCGDCLQKDRCWKQNFFGTYRAFLSALSAQESSREASDEGFGADFAQNCPRAAAISERLQQAALTQRMRASYDRRIEEGKSLVGRQLAGVCSVMEELADAMDLDLRLQEEQGELVSSLLMDQGIYPEQVLVRQDVFGRLAVQLRVPSCGGKRICRGRLQRILSRALGRAMRLSPECACGNGACVLRYEQVRQVSVRCAIEQASAGEEVCGDAYASIPLGEQQHMLAISDGMGVGIAAAMESTATLRLLQSFYQAGFHEDVIFHTINQLLLLRSQEEMYATVDLCLLDLVEGRARFVKIGAAPTYILRGSEVMVVHTPTLPMGILEDVTPATVVRNLEDGDIVVMVSDGVAGDGEWVEGILPRLKGLSIEAMAARLLQRAQDLGLPEDDRTVMVAQMRREGMGKRYGFPQEQSVRYWRNRVAPVERPAAGGASVEARGLFGGKE